MLLPGRLVVPLLVGALALGPAPASVASPGTEERSAEAAPVRVMLLGDSVTMGSSGDWTWRYRLWKHLEHSGADADLVGPSTDLYRVGDGQPVYADRDFDRDHAAAWGRWAAHTAALVGDLVSDHRPDVLVVNLGVNDLMYDTEAWVLEYRLADLVREAQAADPDLAIVLGEVTQTWLAKAGPAARALNRALPGLARRLTTETSEVLVAGVAAGYTRSHTYDDTHPTAAGEVRIAAAVADSLAELGVGPAYPRPLGTVRPTPSRAPVVTASPCPGRVTLKWRAAPGATRYAVSYSDGGRWRALPRTTGRKAVVTGLAGGREHTFRVRAHKGTSAGATGTAVAVPAPGRVTAVRAERSRTRLVVTWRAAGPARYRVALRAPGRTRVMRTVGQPRIVLRGLAPGRRHVVTIRAVAGGLVGPPARVAYSTRR